MTTEDITKLLKYKIRELQEYEYEAREAKDYPACMYLYGAIIHFKGFLQKLREDNK